MSSRVAVAGIATAVMREESPLKADEIVFACVSDALKQAGLRAQHVGLAMFASMDLYDGRAISNGLVVPAAAGYLQDESRIESDSSLAVTAAASTILAGQVEVAVVVALHMPEIERGLTDDSKRLRTFSDQVSSLTFDVPHGRPIGMSATTALSLQASHAVQSGMTRHELAERAARDISGGAGTAWSNRRSSVDAQAVLASETVTNDLTDLMLPGESAGVVVMVLASEPRIRRARSIHGWLSGWGVSTTPSMGMPGWLEDPGAATRRAAQRAFSMSGVASADDVDVVEYTALTPALQPALEDALGIAAQDVRANTTGGALSSFPGLANGALRISKAFENLNSRSGERALVHSTDNLLGPILAPSSVLVLEKP